jgi:signal transduction histidine kinase
MRHARRDTPLVLLRLVRRAPLLAGFAAFGTAVAAVVAIVTVVVFDARFRAVDRPDLRMIDGAGVGFLTAILASAAVGVGLLRRRPEHPVGWCFAGLSVSIDVVAVTEAYGKYGLLARPGRLPGAASAALASTYMFIVWLVLIALVCSLTPDGRYLSRRWQLASRAMVASGMAWLALALVSPGPLESPFESIDNPWAIDGLDAGWLRIILATTNNVLVLVAAASVAVRFRRSRGDERRQLLWFAVTAVAFLALVVVAFVAATTDSDGLLNFAAAGLVVLLPVGAWLSISQYRLYEVDRILSRAVSYLTVSALMAAVFAIVVVLVARGFGEAVDDSPIAIALATLAVVLATRPVYSAVQDAVDRRFARRRYDAVRQARAFVADPSSHESVECALRGALGDPALRIAYPVANADQWVTEDGLAARPSDAAVLVTRGGRTIAAISHTADATVLAAVIDVAAPELDNARLRAAIAMQLQEVLASRRRIAQAQVDERRRIERDLHDGAQQRLLGTAAQLQAALLNGETERMRTALQLGMAECRQAVIELRELANGLHPAALADGGLAAALEQLPARFPMTTIVDVTDHRYPLDVESALWFVTCEALANAVKHAQSSSVQVRLDEREGCVWLTVDDDGRGGAVPGGNGLRGLADRVEAVGGRLSVGDRHGGGTRVEAMVPCAS